MAMTSLLSLDEKRSKMQLHLKGLQLQLEKSDEQLEGQLRLLQQVKQRYHDALKKKGACRSLLQRRLRHVTDECAAAEQRLQRQWQLRELRERRGEEMLRAARSERAAGRAVFLRDREELNEQLTGLDEVKTLQISHRSRMQRVLGHSGAPSRHREQEVARVADLLARRRRVQQAADVVAKDAEEELSARLPVQARRILERNLTLQLELEAVGKERPHNSIQTEDASGPSDIEETMSCHDNHKIETAEPVPIRNDRDELDDRGQAGLHESNSTTEAATSAETEHSCRTKLQNRIFIQQDELQDLQDIIWAQEVEKNTLRLKIERLFDLGGSLSSLVLSVLQELNAVECKEDPRYGVLKRLKNLMDVADANKDNWNEDDNLNEETHNCG